VSDAECIALLQWALPRLRLRWPGFRKVRGQVCKRIARRMRALGLADAAAYRARLEADPGEWGVLDGLCVVTLSRFYRDRGVWDALQGDVLPALAEAATSARDRQLACWSVGCASGEEPYTLSILWTLALGARYPRLPLRVLATDLEAHVLERARAAHYAGGSLRDLPSAWLEQAFERRDGSFVLRDRFRTAVELRQEDVRRVQPSEVFRLILCRNLVLTYFDEARQREVLGRILATLAPGGAFVIGRHERLPRDTPLEPWHPQLGIYRHVPTRFRAVLMNPPTT
jgi:chemotaxis protein methyltransferase CheR